MEVNRNTFPPTPEQSALEEIASIAEHCAFAAAAFPANEESLSWLGQKLVGIMDLARKGAGMPPRDWDLTAIHSPSRP